MEMTNSVIWIRLSATLSPLQGPFPVYVTGMSHFSGMPYTVVEIRNFDWASCIHHLCEATVISDAKRHSNVLQNTRCDQSMQKNKGKATYSAYAFIHLAIEGTTVQEHPDNSETTLKINTTHNEITHTTIRRSFPPTLVQCDAHMQDSVHALFHVMAQP